MGQQQAKQNHFKALFPILALGLLLLDGRFTMMFSLFSNTRNICSVQFLLLLFIVAYFKVGAGPYLYAWTLIFGILYDLYYYGIIGIYAFCFPMMIFILQHISMYLKKNIPSYLMLFLLCTIWVLYGSYFMQVLFSLTQLDFLSYMILYVAPSLLFSTLMYYTALIYGKTFFLGKDKNRD